MNTLGSTSGSESGGSPPSKHRVVYRYILDGIRTGEFRPRQKLPSDQELSRQFKTSRMTVIRALNDLQTEGYVNRRAGSGSFVSAPPSNQSLTFGLLIPDLGMTEIFEPICRGMAQADSLGPHVLLWGKTPPGVSNHETLGRELCRFFISQKASGVFFAPLELTPHMDEVNREIANGLDQAGIPIILLDRCILPYPYRSRYDLVGIDNRLAGYRMAEHLLQHGCRSLIFFARPRCAPAVDGRIAGFRDAHIAWKLPLNDKMVQRCETDEPQLIAKMLEECKPDGVVCANDLTAGRLMQTLAILGVSVPRDLRIVGFDDVKYSHLLSVPLTTLRQPCHAMGAAAITAMLDRIAHPTMPAREILLDCELVVRQSCGAALP
jgi:DNA-binding LacI/PurR family transcriptional regulator